MNYYYKTLLIITLVSTLLSCSKNEFEIQNIDLIPVLSGEKYQYINNEGKTIINPQFEVAGLFYDDLALASLTGDGDYGFIDKSGKFVINPQYLSATSFSEGIAWVVSKNEAPKAIDKKGKILFQLKEAKSVSIFKGGLASFYITNSENEKLYGFVNKKGITTIHNQFLAVGNFMGELCPVMNKDRKWGYIDKEGKIVIPFQFDFANNFVNDYAIVNLSDKAGVINKNGKYIVNPQFDQIFHDQKSFMVVSNNKYGWVNTDGQYIVNPQFEMALPFLNNTLTPVVLNEKFGFIDKEGKIVINEQFDYAFAFNNKIAAFESGNKYGFINQDGKYVINPMYDGLGYDYIYYLENGISCFNSVETDLFNINNFISEYDFFHPKGLNINDTFEKAYRHFGNENYEYDLSDLQHLIAKQEINKNLEVSVLVYGSPYEYDWYSGYEYYGDTKIDGYSVSYSLIKDYDSQIEKFYFALVDQFEKKGFAVINNEYDEYSEIYLKNDNEIGVLLIQRGNSVKVIVSKDFSTLEEEFMAVNYGGC